MDDLYGYVEQTRNTSTTSNRQSTKFDPKQMKTGEEAFSHVFKDPDQVAKYDAIIELLLAAGYFRARISGLSHFDKVIGGLTWCIASSQVDIDIDLLFQEDSTMGMKIQLGEIIEKTLTRMKCPHPLRSYQIRGLDFISIHPVIQWLVTKVIEVREETGDLIRTVSEWNFGRKFHYQLPADEEFNQRKEVATGFAKQLAFKYKPSRTLRNKASISSSEEDQVQSTLLEYGHKAYREVNQDKKQMNKSSSQTAKIVEAALGGASAESDAAKEAREADERRFQQMLKNMESTTGQEISDNALGLLMGMQKDVISKMEGTMEGQSAIPAGMSSKQFEEEQHNRKLESLQKAILALKQKLLSQKEPHQTLLKQKQELEAIVGEKSANNQHIIDSLAKYDAMINDDNRSDIEMLRALVLLNENLKRQEEQFRANCKKQLNDLKEKIKTIQDTDPGALDTERDKLIRETHEKDYNRLIEHRQALGKKIRDIVMVERKIDEIPSRSELQQYQLQFIELYEQVASKLTETRKYYQNYNTLNTTLTYLTREISLINSISSNYKTAMKSKKSKESLMEQLTSILSIANEALAKAEQRINDEKQTLHNLNSQYQNLVSKERAYHLAVKEFGVECEKNEKLLAKLQSA